MADMPPQWREHALMARQEIVDLFERHPYPYSTVIFFSHFNYFSLQNRLIDNTHRRRSHRHQLRFLQLQVQQP